LPDALLDKLRAAVGAPNVLTGVELSPYVVEGRTPEAAVFPGSVDEVAAVIGLAAEAARPVTPWGGGTAVSVGMPAAPGGLVLGLRRLSRLLEHEPGDLTASAEAGMTVEAFQTALRGLKYGTVTAVVQDGIVVQVDRTEKIRIEKRGPA